MAGALAQVIETGVLEAELTTEKTERPRLKVVHNTSPVAAKNSVHKGVFKALAAVNAGVLGVFWWTFRGDAEALFMVAISAAYLAAYMGTPLLLSRIGGRIDPIQTKPFDAFLNDPFETWTGTVTGREAMIQILMVPVAILLAVIGMSFMIELSR